MLTASIKASVSSLRAHDVEWSPEQTAEFLAAIATTGASLERFAQEIRHLQRTEVLEVEEYFSPGQKGSSAMPHKRNPVLSENLTGLARMVRSAVIPAMENVALWHERDISHSSVERYIAPDATITLDFALARAANVELVARILGGGPQSLSVATMLVLLAVNAAGIRTGAWAQLAPPSQAPSIALDSIPSSSDASCVCFANSAAAI